MGLFTGRGMERRQVFPEPPISPFPGTDMRGFVSPGSKPDTALQIPTVWACVSLLAGSVSSLPLQTFRKVTGDPTAIPSRIADSPLVLNPDDNMTQSEWLYMVMVSLLLRGNAYGLVRRDAMMRPTSVHLLNPDDIKVKLNDDGTVTYRRKMDDKVIPTADVWHIRGLTLPGSVVGLSPITYAAAVLGLDLASRDFASGFFEGGGIPKAVLESDQQVNQEQARTIKDRVVSTFRGRDPLVLGLGLKYTQIQVKPEESQFLKTQEANVTQIAKFFGVPAAMVDGPSGHGMTYTNTEQRAIEFLTYSLSPWLKRIEDSMFSLLPGTQYVQFEVKNLLRLDAHTQAQVDLFELAGKIVAPSEVRARRGLPPMTPDQLKEAAMVPLSISPLGRPTGGVAGALHEDPLAATPVPVSEDPTGA